MKRILIHIPMEPHGEYDIFSPYNRNAIVNMVNQNLTGSAPNFGNRLWFQGLISAIQCAENHLEYFSPDMTKEQINNDYDFVIAPMANVFSIHYGSLLERLAERFRGIKIPVYVIACGIQADSFDQLDELVTTLKEPATKFISSVYKTGGEFAVRGYFTKEFFEKLGFHSAVATGCPSLFQLGRNLSISDEKVPESRFKPILNGSITDYLDFFKRYKCTEFFDQNIYFRELFALKGDDLNILKAMLYGYGMDTTKLLLQDRVKLIPHMNLWREYIRQKGFNFSYGSRIHGSIMPILSGVPAVLEAQDARTREMAEFFNVPLVEKGAHKNYKSLYELYRDTSYKKFNDEFPARFDAYEQFLKKFGIVDKINQKNDFFYPVDELPPITDTQESREKLYRCLNKKKLYWNSYTAVRNIKRKLFG